MAAPFLYEPTWERIIRAVEKVRERLQTAVAALEAGGVPYAVIGGNAVANWVARVDEEAVRNTRDVDILIRRADLPAAIKAMDTVGWDYANVNEVDLFVERPNGKPSAGIHLIFANEKVRDSDPVETPDVTDSELAVTGYRVVSLEGLVRMKLVAYRRKDQVHLQDLTRLGLIDATWPDRFPQVLADRLREILADPDG
jgi:hypothetical protein